MSILETADSLPALRGPRAIRGYTILEMAVASLIFITITAAVGSALGTGGEVFGDGVLRSDLNATARRVVNRILAEIEETQSDSPGFAVGSDFVTYNQVEAIAGTGPTYGSERRIGWLGSGGKGGALGMTITADGVEEEFTNIATGLEFALNDSRLTVTVTVARTDAHGQSMTQSVTGDVNVHR